MKAILIITNNNRLKLTKTIKMIIIKMHNINSHKTLLVFINSEDASGINNSVNSNNDNAQELFPKINVFSQSGKFESS